MVEAQVVKVYCRDGELIIGETIRSSCQVDLDRLSQANLRSAKGIGIAYQGKVVHVNEPIPLEVRVVDNPQPRRETPPPRRESVCQAATTRKADLNMTDNDILRGHVNRLRAEVKTLKNALRVRAEAVTHAPMSFRGVTADAHGLSGSLSEAWGPGPMAYVPRGFSLPKPASTETARWPTTDRSSRDIESLKESGPDTLQVNLAGINTSEGAECIVSSPSCEADRLDEEASPECPEKNSPDSDEPGQAPQVTLEDVREMAQRAREAQLAAQLAQEQAEMAKAAAQQALEAAQREQAELAKEREALEAAQREADLAMERQALEAARREQADLAKERQALEAAQEADLAMERQALEAAQREQAELAKERQAIEAAQQRRWAPSGLTRSVGAQPPTQKPPRTFDGRFRKPPPPRREPPRVPPSASSTRGTPQTAHTEAYTRRTVEKLLDVLIERTHADDAVLRQLQASALLQFTQSQKTAFQATAQRTAHDSESVNWPRAVMSIAMALEKHLAGRTV